MTVDKYAQKVQNVYAHYAHKTQVFYAHYAPTIHTSMATSMVHALP